MFSKIFKKSQEEPLQITELPQQIDTKAVWQSKLQAAIGNDAELMQLAIDVPMVELKLVAVQALSTEEALKTAEREFRKHDRRVHRLAKHRYETEVRQRESRAKASELILSAEALLDAAIIPSNRLVELIQAWEILDPLLIEHDAQTKFKQLLSELARLMLQRSEHKRDVSLWLTAAKLTLRELQSACNNAATADSDVDEHLVNLALSNNKAQSTLAAISLNATTSVTENSAIAELEAAIKSALQDAATIATKLQLLQEFQGSSIPSSPSPSNIERWQALPPIATGAIENRFKSRLNEILNRHADAQKKQQSQQRKSVSEHDKAELHSRIQTVKEIATAMENALAAGQLSEAGNQLTLMQTAAAKGGLSAELQKRVGALQSEFSRLKGWQHWGGGRVRDELVVEAETLAASTIVTEGERPNKLPLKQLEKNIELLRARWKELDRLGGATSKALWGRFDGALKTAFLPVAANLAQLNAERHENLVMRKNLLATLDGFNINQAEANIPIWKEIGHALADFQIQWRKLGPIEHTVPHKSRAALVAQMEASVARLEIPLKQIQAEAEAEREQLIVRVKALGNDVNGRNLLLKLRELQTQWQLHAKARPLPRKAENRLWAEFKVAADALMSQREAIFSARNEVYKSNQVQQETLIARLETLTQTTPAGEIKSMLASVETEWRAVGEAPKNQADKLDSRYRAAREQALNYAAGSARRISQLNCENILLKLALCVEKESSTASADLDTRWQNSPAIPSRWEQVLQARYQAVGAPAGKDSAKAEPFDSLLLQLESSLSISSPPEFQAARSKLKFIAMKNALEGRGTNTMTLPEIEKVTLGALAYAHLSEQQHDRLRLIIESLHNQLQG
jgi:hypothetical protein